MDITEQKQAEEKIKRTADEWIATFDSIADLISIQDENFKLVRVNKAYAHALKMSPEELIGKRCYEVIHVMACPIANCPHEQTLNTKASVSEEIFEPRLGVYLEVSTSPVFNAKGGIAGSVHIAKDITSRKLSEEKLRKSLAGTIQAMSLTVETRDPYTAGHQRKVSTLARAIAQEMGLSNDTVDTIRMAGIIHDIGKISVPAEILSKPTKLSDIEFSLIKVHSQTGYDILKDVGLPYPVAEIAYQHHERLDGSGYPQGLKGDNILLEARIISVADVVEAISSHRPYRPGFGIDIALEEIEKNKGILYDEKAVEACLKLFREKNFKLD